MVFIHLNFKPPLIEDYNPRTLLQFQAKGPRTTQPTKRSNYGWIYTKMGGRNNAIDRNIVLNVII